MGRLTTLKPRLPVLRVGRMPMHTMAEHRRIRGAAWEALRREVMQRDKGLCQPCAREQRIAAASQVDHVTPQWEGGSDHPTNLQAICRTCHEAKTAQEARRRHGQG